MGFDGPAQLANHSFVELDDLHQIGHIDAAFRMHNSKNPDDHHHIYFILDDKVFKYYNHSLEEEYPKKMEEEFPGVPIHLDAAVECPKGECMADSVLFFKGHDVHVYDIATKTVKTKTWDHLPVCTSALHWQEHYYCFHGHDFTRFHPVTGEVTGPYPKDARKYFMQCADHAHGGHTENPKCSEAELSAITTDDAGKSYLFSGPMYMRLDTRQEGLHAFQITKQWKEMTSGVDAAFSHNNNMYLIKGEHIYIYKTAIQYTLIDGYPKPMKEELGIEGNVDAAFVCPNEDTVHIIQGGIMNDVNLATTPRVVSDRPVPLPVSGINATMCNAEGIYLFKGAQYYHYETPMLLGMSRMAPRLLPITNALLGCQD